MQIKSFVFNSFYENTIILASENSNCFIFDPGCYEPYEIEELAAFIRKGNLQVKTILNTHCHIDHVLGNDYLKNYYKVPLLIPKNEKEIFAAVPAYAPQWGITRYKHAEVDGFLEEGKNIELNEITIQLIEVPGHSPGHVMFYLEKEGIIIGGDVLFRESIGRTDLPGGNHDTLLNNIREKVYALPDDTVVYPGHGSTTTIGHEKKHNPFMRS